MPHDTPRRDHAWVNRGLYYWCNQCGRESQVEEAGDCWVHTLIDLPVLGPPPTPDVLHTTGGIGGPAPAFTRLQLVREQDDRALDALIGDLLAEVDRRGLVLTVDQVPLQPLAMGHYRTTYSLRARRDRA